MFRSTFPALRALRTAVLAFTLGCGIAHGQSLILRPAVVPLSGQPGQSVTQQLTLQNDSDQPLEFEMRAQDVVVRDGKREFVEPGRRAGSIAVSAVFTPPKVRVQPHASSTVTATFTLPAGVTQRAVVALFRGTQTLLAQGKKATLSLGTLFTFTLSDRISVRAQGLVATPPTPSANAQLVSRLLNDGDEPVVPSGMAVILDEHGAMVGKAAFTARRLLPGEALDVTAEYLGELAPGAYRAVATFDIAGRPLTLSSNLTVQ